MYQETGFERLQRCVRNRLALAVTTIVALLVTVFVTITACLFIESSRAAEAEARHQAELAHQAERTAKHDEQAAKEMALQWLSDGLEAADEMLIGQTGSLQFYPGLEANRTEMLEQAVRNYTRFAACKSDDPRMQAACAKSYLRLGDAHQQLHHNVEAELAHRRASEIFAGLSGQHPDNDEYQLQLANSHIGVGLSLLRQADRVQDATDAFDSALAILKRLVRIGPDNIDFLSPRSRCQIALGRLLKEHDPEKARESLQHACNELGSLVDEDAGPLVDLLYSARSELGQLHRRSSQLELALDCFNRVIRGYTDRLEESSLRPDYYESRMINLIHQGNTHHALGQDQAAQASYEAAIEDYHNLMAVLYRGQYHSENLAISMVNLAQIKTANGNGEQALETLLAARQEFIELIALHGQQPRFIRQLAATTVAIGDAHHEQGDLENAGSEYDRAEPLFVQMLDMSIADRLDRQRYLTFGMHRCALLFALDQTAEAVERMRVVDHEVRKLHEVSGEDHSLVPLQVRASIALADLLFASGDEHESAEHYRHARTLLCGPADDVDLLTKTMLLADCPMVSVRDIPAALDQASTLVESDRANPDHWFALSLAQYRGGHWSESLTSIRRSFAFRLVASYLRSPPLGCGSAWRWGPFQWELWFRGGLPWRIAPLMIRVRKQQETMRLSRVPASSLDRYAAGLRLRWPPRRLTFSVTLDVAFQQVETVRGSHLSNSGVAFVFIPLSARRRTFWTTM